MNNFTSVTGVITVRACPETAAVLEELRALAEGMDGEGVRCAEHTPGGVRTGILVVEVDIYGCTSAAHAQEIDDKIRELGPYAVEAAEITGIHGCFFVGTEEEVVRAESRDALMHILGLAHKLEERDAGDALQAILRRSRMPTFKHAYFRSFCSACPFCGDADIRSGAPEADGMIAWAAVECAACGHAWQDVWTMIGMTEVRDADGHEVASRRTAG